MGLPLQSKFPVLTTSDILLLRYKGVFDFEGLYRMMHAWIINKRFLFHEVQYKDKVFTPFGNELEIKWTGERKASEFVKEHISIQFHLWDFAEVEVIKEGKKVKMTKSRMEIRIRGDLELDYTKKFKGSKFMEKLGDFYVNKILYWDIRLKYGDPLAYMLHDLHTKIKKYLNMDSPSNAY